MYIYSHAVSAFFADGCCFVKFDLRDMHVNERCRRKEERSMHTNNKAKQHSTPETCKLYEEFCLFQPVSTHVYHTLSHRERGVAK